MNVVVGFGIFIHLGTWPAPGGSYGWGTEDNTAVGGSQQASVSPDEGGPGSSG